MGSTWVIAVALGADRKAAKQFKPRRFDRVRDANRYREDLIAQFGRVLAYEYNATTFYLQAIRGERSYLLWTSEGSVHLEGIRAAGVGERIFLLDFLSGRWFEVDSYGEIQPIPF